MKPFVTLLFGIALFHPAIAQTNSQKSSGSECEARIVSLKAKALAAWQDAELVKQMAKEHPESAVAKAAADAALAKAAEIAADSAQEAADLDSGQCVLQHAAAP